MGEDMDSTIRDVLQKSRVIAVVGWSPKPDRPSHRVAGVLASLGWRVVPVNPGHAGLDVGYGTVYATLEEAHAAVGPIDMVDVFRRSEEVGPVVEAAQRIGASVLWMQLGVINEAAAAAARGAGMAVVMDRCPAIEVPRLGIFGPEAGPTLV